MFKLFDNTKESVNLKCSVTAKVTVYLKKKKSQNTVQNFLKIETLSLYKQKELHDLFSTSLYSSFFFKDKKKKSIIPSNICP